MTARIIPYAVAAGLAALVLWLAYQHGVSTTTADWAARWEKQGRELAAAKAKAERIQRDEEQRRQADIEKVRDYAREQIERAQADAAAAADAADGLRKQARRLAARASQAGSHSAAAGGSKTAPGAAVVLADVLARADQRAGELASAYDRARAAGNACERAYDALTESEPKLE